jgi:hypothetical protein
MNGLQNTVALDSSKNNKFLKSVVVATQPYVAQQRVAVFSWSLEFELQREFLSQQIFLSTYLI